MEYTKREAAEFLGVGVKMVEKYLADGRLKGTLRTGRHGTQRVFDQAELDALKAQREAVTYLPTTIPPTAPPARRESMALVPADKVDAFISALETLQAVASRSERTPVADLAHKLTLTTSDAATLSGLPVATIRDAIRRGALPSFGRGRGRRIRRTDLDAWIAGL